MNKKWIFGILSGVITSVIASVILSWLTNWNPLAFTKRVLLSILALFSKNYSLPLWAIVLIALAPVSALILLQWIASWRGVDSYKDYVIDMIDGVVWQWKYMGNWVDELMPICRKCQSELKPEKITHFRTDPAFRLTCPRCDFVTEVHEDSYPMLVHDVRKEIERRIRTGLFVRILAGKEI